MKKVLCVAVGIMVITSLSACSNTFNGAGRDMENMGEWVQEKT